jgi:hypothetical protein
LLPGAGVGLVTLYVPDSEPVCAPAEGQPKLPPELVIEGTTALFIVAEENTAGEAVPFLQAMPPAPEVPLPTVCLPEIVSVQLSVGTLIVIVQPTGISTHIGMSVADLYWTFSLRADAPVALHTAGTSTVAAKPNAVQPLYVRVIGVVRTVAVPVGVVPEIVELHETVPPPDTASELFVDVAVNATPLGVTVVAEADAATNATSARAITAARPSFLMLCMDTPP